MYCLICKKYTKEGAITYGGCGHYPPVRIFAEKNKHGKYILVEYFRLRSASHRHWPDAKGLQFDTQTEAMIYAWNTKNKEEIYDSRERMGKTITGTEKRNQK